MNLNVEITLNNRPFEIRLRAKFPDGDLHYGFRFNPMHHPADPEFAREIIRAWIAQGLREIVNLATKQQVCCRDEFEEFIHKVSHNEGTMDDVL